MITLKHKYDCTGCHACQQICPTSAIEMVADDEGFLYPEVDSSKCVECGKCLKTCPVIHPSAPQKPTAVYASYSNNKEIRSESSSGGIFTLIARKTLLQGGVVYGAQYNSKFEVEHIAIEREEELHKLRGSKYSQSNINSCYSEIKTHLSTGRQVLFVGTPCQVAGLKLYLGKEQSNLTLIDFICHGVPSPKVWRRYLDELNLREITHIAHRDKSSGWHNYSVSIEGVNHNGAPFKSTEPYFSNTYIRGFLSDLYLRPSCHHCPTKGFSSGSDITIADYWEAEREIADDDKGLSMVIPHTEHGRVLFESLDATTQQGKQSSIQKIAYTSPRAKKARKEFFKAFNQGDERLDKIVDRLTVPPIYKRFTRSIRKMLKI